jgi:hypothetical protein
MARIKNNVLVKGASGNLGKQVVYKQRGNDTHMALMPKTRKDASPTEKQEGVRELFTEAAQYAKGAVSSPDIKKEYQKKASNTNTAYNIAFRDFLKAPVVKSIDTGRYDGSPGSTIVVKAKDDFRVVEVVVSIHNAAGVLVEKGNAVLNPLDRNKWIYTATQQNATVAGSVISAKALDLPGNSAMLDLPI